MANHSDILKSLSIFSNLDDDGISAVDKLTQEESFKSGETVFNQGDESGKLFIIAEGAIEISTTVREDLKKPLVTLRSGSLLGEVSILDNNPRESAAICVEDAKLLTLSSEAFRQLCDDDPKLGNIILKTITQTVVNRIRITTEQYRDHMQWGLQVSGALSLNWHHLITDETNLNLKLSNGEELKGRFLKVDESPTGKEIFVLSDDQKVSIVPYHGISRVSFERVDVMATKSKA